MNSNRDSKAEKDVQCSRSGMDCLPREISLDVLSRLPITSLMRFRYASKSWQKLSCDPHLIKLHFSRSAKNSTCLIFRCGYPSGYQLRFMEFYDHNNEKQVVGKFKPPYPTPIPEVNLVGSCNGLICLSNSKNHDVIQIFNPFTRSYKQLPKSRQFDDQKVVVGFGFHPLTNEYKVVRIVYYQYQSVNERSPRFARGFRCVYPQSEVQVYSIGSNEWRCIGKMRYQIEPRLLESLFVNGRLHWLTRSGYGGGYLRRIISFDLASEQFTTIPAPAWAGIRTYPYPLAVLGGCLSVVVYPQNGNIEIWVMKEYGIRESWSKMFKIDFNNSIQSGLITSVQPLAIQILCLMKNGDLLLKHDGVVAFYDPESRVLKDVTLEGMPKWYQVIVHEGSLVCIGNL